MSSDDGDTPQMRPLPQMPTMAELMDVFDHITGVETIKVKGANGKEQLVTKRIQRSLEEQEKFTMLGKTIKRSFQALRKMSNYNPLAVVDYAPFLNVINTVNQNRKNDMEQLSNLSDFDSYVKKFKETGNTIIQNEFQKAENENNAYLADSGYSNSSAAIAMRNSLVSEKAKALAQNDLSGNLYGEQLKAADQTNRRNEFEFRELGRQGLLQSAEYEHQLKNQQFNQRNAERQQYLQNQTNLWGLADSVVDRDQRYAMASQLGALSNQITQQTNANKINAYSAEAGAINTANQIDQQAYVNRGPSFGEAVLGLGMTGLGAYGGSYLGAMGNAMGNQAAMSRKYK